MTSPAAPRLGLATLIIALAAAAVLVAVWFVNYSDDDSEEPEASPAPTTSEPTAAPTTTAPPEFVPATVVTDAEVDDLIAPEGFKTMLKEHLADARNFPPGEDCGAPQYDVEKLTPDGWAAGKFFQARCDGYGVLWAAPDDQWQEVWGGQTLVDCETLTTYGFPAEIAGDTCDDGTAAVAYP